MSAPAHPLSALLLSLPELAYASAVHIRNRLYDRPGASRRTRIPVLSVGNLTVGGTGKTPVVAWLALRLRKEGRTPAVVSRGYRGRAGKGPLVVSVGRGPLVGPEWSGDEPFLIAQTLTGVLVVVGSDRIASAEAARRAGADVVLLDDGFQHRRMARDLDLVLLDATSPFGNYHLLPAGTLREPISALSRADAVMLTRSRHGESFGILEHIVARQRPGIPIFHAGHRATCFVDAHGRPVPPPRRVVAFCGIGNPGRFFEDLDQLEVQTAARRAFRDHHVYSNRELRELRALAGRADAALVTTEKDMVRIPRGLGFEEPPLLALRIEAEPHEPGPLLDLVRATLVLP